MIPAGAALQTHLMVQSHGGQYAKNSGFDMNLRDRRLIFNFAFHIEPVSRSWPAATILETDL